MRPNWKRRRIILTALFTSLAVVLGYILAAVPNVELMTLTVFLSGVFAGPRYGAVTGILSITLYSFFNPFGISLPPLLAAQITGFLVVGVVGGLLRARVFRGGGTAVIIIAVAGFITTLLYDILTTVASAYVALGGDGFSDGIIGFFSAGSVFIIIHV
ncbi:ECF transporter S component, partial [bacterium]|nr:ECF transporter S component [bacterium]